MGGKRKRTSKNKGENRKVKHSSSSPAATSAAEGSAIAPISELKRGKTHAPLTIRAGSGVDRQAIAERAYRLFESGGGAHGSDVEHWLQAERELCG